MAAAYWRRHTIEAAVDPAWDIRKATVVPEAMVSSENEVAALKASRFASAAPRPVQQSASELLPWAELLHQRQAAQSPHRWPETFSPTI